MNLITVTYDADKYQLVPREATAEMQAAANFNDHGHEELGRAIARTAYSAMLAAAPQPETTETVPDGWRQAIADVRGASYLAGDVGSSLVEAICDAILEKIEKMEQPK